jgi:hypothetical protein
MLRVSKLTESEIVERYKSGIRINKIAEDAGVTRQAIWGTLKRLGVHEPEHGKVELTCAFCGEKYVKYRSCATGLYCSIPCYNADKGGVGYYGKRGTMAENERIHNTSIRTSRGRARKSVNADGKVVHHIDGNPFNNAPENLMLFDDHAAHMRYHHEQRMKKHAAIPRKKRKASVMLHSLRCVCEICKPVKESNA